MSESNGQARLRRRWLRRPSGFVVVAVLHYVLRVPLDRPADPAVEFTTSDDGAW